MESVQQLVWAEVLRTARHMEWTSSSTSANSAAPLPNGFVGVTRISARLVTKGSVAEITYLENPKTSYLSVRALEIVR